MSTTNKIELLGLKLDNLSSSELLAEVENDLETGTKARLVFVNVDVAVKADHDNELKEIINSSDYGMVDGMPIKWLADARHLGLKEKVSGADFVPLLCGMAARKGYSVFILGGADHVAEAAAEKLKEDYRGIRIAGCYAPPMGFETDEVELAKTCDRISSCKPDILIVCLGCPKQEKFVYENSGRYDAQISVCAGATVDFLAGRIRRCPKWMSNAGLEWFYRFLMEPRRLFRRYFIDDLEVLKLMFKHRGSQVRRRSVGCRKTKTV